MQEAIENGAKVEIGGQTDGSENYIAPTLLSAVEDPMKIMEEEIFGPILPIVSFEVQTKKLSHTSKVVKNRWQCISIRVKKVT